MDMRKESELSLAIKPKPRNYGRHTDECGGIDPIVVNRILAAGTINAIPADHYICDCERAYIAKDLRTNLIMTILKVNSQQARKLKELGQQLWNQ